MRGVREGQLLLLVFLSCNTGGSSHGAKFQNQLTSLHNPHTHCHHKINHSCYTYAIKQNASAYFPAHQLLKISSGHLPLGEKLKH